ncbi:M50 family metallopeptidase [Bernardetia sp.]|uniref:M50 family metallopeptidase n=1 Tax=Bernardetia sp. TaxID=1937974 RepID=UPI0025B8C418|nr:M50 family metallopeptidase [Bernardetia sp.]
MKKSALDRDAIGYDSLSQKEVSARQNSSLTGLLIAAVITVVLFNVPYGYYISYPFSILGTWFHEMGHGIMALLWGGDFIKLVMYSNGSGVATTTSYNAIAQAFVSAAGLMTPPIIGAALILAGRTQRGSKIAMSILGAALIISVVFLVRSWFGVLAVSLWGALIITFAFKLPVSYKPFVVQFLGVQAWASTFRSLDYMFSDYAGSLGMQSDTQSIANILILPYWFWGGVIAAFAIVMLLVSLKIAFKK